MNSNINICFQKAIPYVLTVFFAYILASIFYFLLPQKGIEVKKSVNVKLKYREYSGFYSKTIEKEKREIQRKVQKKVSNIFSQYKLNAIYSTTLNSGWIVLENKTSKKSLILEKNEEIERYRLISLYKKYVVFEKDSKEYRFELPRKKEIKYEIN